MTDKDKSDESMIYFSYFVKHTEFAFPILGCDSSFLNLGHLNRKCKSRLLFEKKTQCKWREKIFAQQHFQKKSFAFIFQY